MLSIIAHTKENSQMKKKKKNISSWNIYSELRLENLYYVGLETCLHFAGHGLTCRMADKVRKSALIKVLRTLASFFRTLKIKQTLGNKK